MGSSFGLPQPVHIANTVAYAQPVIALALGWLLLAEPITTRTLAGVAVILAGVILIVASASRTRPEAEADTERAIEFEELAA